MGGQAEGWEAGSEMVPRRLPHPPPMSLERANFLLLPLPASASTSATLPVTRPIRPTMLPHVDGLIAR